MATLDGDLDKQNDGLSPIAPALNKEEVLAILDTMNEANIIGLGGKTKIVYQIPGKENLVVLDSKDKITAGDGAREDQLIGKAALSNQTSNIVFEYLNAQGIYTHFHQQLSPTAFLAEKCNMIPLEVIYRYAATGSYLKRNKEVKEGEVFETPVYELCYKRDVISTNGKKISDAFIELDKQGNPVMTPDGFRLSLIDPKTGEKFDYTSAMYSLLDKEILLTSEQHDADMHMIHQYAAEIRTQTPMVFDAIKTLYGVENLYLVDGKIEFGVDVKGNVRLADVFDADSGRVRVNPETKKDDDKNYLIKGEALDKQGYRENESTNETMRKYERLLAHLKSAEEKKRLADMSQRI